MKLSTPTSPGSAVQGVIRRRRGTAEPTVTADLSVFPAAIVAAVRVCPEIVAGRSAHWLSAPPMPVVPVAIDLAGQDVEEWRHHVSLP